MGWRTFVSGQSSPLSQELVGHNYRPMGLGHCPRVQNIIKQLPSPASSTLAIPPFTRGTSRSRRAVEKNGRDRSDRETGADERWVLQSPLCDAQDRRSLEACIQSEGPQRICSDRTFQNGVPERCFRYPGERLVHGKTRHEGCLPFNQHSPVEQEVAALPVERPSLAIHVPTLWPVGLPEDLHQSSATSGITTEIMGSQDGGVSRRLVNCWRIPSRSPPWGPCGNVPTSSSWVPSELAKVRVGTNTMPGIPWDQNLFTRYGIFPAQTEVAVHPAGMPKTSGSRLCNTYGTAPSQWKDSGCQEGHPISPGPQSWSAMAPECSTPDGNDPTHGRSFRQPAVLDSASRSGEQQAYSVAPSNSYSGNGCIQSRMGRDQQRSVGAGTMDSTRPISHQLERTESRQSRIESSLEPHQRQHNPARDRQCDCCGIREQPRRHTLMAVVPPCCRHLDLGLRSEPSPCSSSCSRRHEHVGRQTVQIFGGRQQRLAATPPGFQSGFESSRTIVDRPVCCPTQPTAEELCQLATGPGSSSSGCTESSRSHVGGCVSISPILPGGFLPEVHQQAQDSSSGLDSTSLAQSTLLSHSVVNAGGNPLVSSVPSTATHQSSGSVSSSPGQTGISRVDYLRQSVRHQGLSENATTLWLSSWRQATNSSYDSAWRIWVRWCQQRSFSPMAGHPPVVANFLADQYSEGKQYRTINSYRSALSSTLPVAQSGPIGQTTLVKRLMTGIYNARPPQPRYSQSWKVSTVLSSLKSWGSTPDLSKMQLSQKLAMLLALTKAPRSSELRGLSLKHMRHLPDGVVFELTCLTKTQRPGSAPKTFTVSSFSDDSLLCPLACLMEYISKTAPVRSESNQALFISTRHPFQPVSSSTIARWLKEVIAAAGHPEFAGHSTRGASTTAALQGGVSLADVLATADWTGDSTFLRHYYRPATSAAFPNAVLAAEQDDDPSSSP